MKRATILISLAVSAFIGSRAAAEDGKVRELAEQYQESKKEIVDSESQKRRILGSLYSINRRMKKIAREKGHLTDELFHVQDNVQNIATVIAGLETQIAEQRTRLRSRLRTLYMLSGESYIAMLFAQANSQSMDQTLKYLKIVTDADYRLIRSYQKNIAMYKDQRKRLKTQVQRLISLEKRIKKQESLLIHEHHAKTEIVTNLERSRIEAMRRIRKIRNQTEQLKNDEGEEEIVGMLKASFFEKKGQIQHPVQGNVVQDFGLVRDEHYKIQMSHKGWLYSAAAGSAVSAVFDGVIAHSGWINGYGHAIIVDHGDHYYTVYGHVTAPKAKLGEAVKAGQTIAEAGSDSHPSGSGLYFEVRHFSEPENPRHWLRARGLPVSKADEKKSERAKLDQNTADSVELATAPQLGTQ